MTIEEQIQRYLIEQAIQRGDRAMQGEIEELRTELTSERRYYRCVVTRLLDIKEAANG